jgi:hypothetical protein
MASIRYLLRITSSNMDQRFFRPSKPSHGKSDQAAASIWGFPRDSCPCSAVVYSLCKFLFHLFFVFVSGGSKTKGTLGQIQSRRAVADKLLLNDWTISRIQILIWIQILRARVPHRKRKREGLARTEWVTAHIFNVKFIRHPIQRYIYIYIYKWVNQYIYI